MLELHEVSKVYDGVAVVDAVSLCVPEGQTTAIIGPSGCGKSTLIRLMNGLIGPDAGRVSFRGQALTPANAPALRRHMGYVIQEGGLFPHYTARGNITLMTRYLGWSRRRMDTQVAQLAGLTHFPVDALDRYPSELSGGQRQRVALMRALMLDPDVMLLDEPLGALDPMIRYELQAELRHVFGDLGKTVVLVTHDLAEAAYFGDQVVLLRAGRIEQQGPMSALLHSPATPFVRRFINAQRGLADSLSS